MRIINICLFFIGVTNFFIGFTNFSKDINKIKYWTQKREESANYWDSKKNSLNICRQVRAKRKKRNIKNNIKKRQEAAQVWEKKIEKLLSDMSSDDR